MRYGKYDSYHGAEPQMGDLVAYETTTYIPPMAEQVHDYVGKVLFKDDCYRSGEAEILVAAEDLVLTETGHVWPTRHCRMKGRFPGRAGRKLPTLYGHPSHMSIVANNEPRYTRFQEI